MGKESAFEAAGAAGDTDSIPGPERPPWRRIGKPPSELCQKNPMAEDPAGL